MREREGERRERDTARETQIERERERNRERDIDRERDRERETDSEQETQIYRAREGERDCVRVRLCPFSVCLLGALHRACSVIITGVCVCCSESP